MRRAAQLFFVAIFFFLFLSFPTKSHAQTSQIINPYVAPNTAPNVPKNLHTWTQGVFIEVISAISCQLSGIDPTHPDQPCLGVDAKTGQIGYVRQGNGGAIGIMGNMVGMLYTPPLHLSSYTDYLTQNFGITKKTYAKTTDYSKGIGYPGLLNLTPFWVTMRNLVYLMYILVFIVVGLAIMLRVKIDPHTVMTIQNQIPRVIVSLILVTFSLPIAGLLIDLMYIVIYFIFNVFASIPNGIPLKDISNTAQTFQSDTAFGAFNNLLGLINVPAEVSTKVAQLITSFIAGGSWYTGIIKVPFIGGFIQTLFSGIPFIIILIAILYSVFRLWFQLITAYVYFLIDVVFAPFMIGASALPGAPIGFGVWLRDILANLSAFPVAIAMLLLGGTFMDISKGSSSSIFVAPLIGTGGDISNTIGSIIGLGIILIAPQALTMTRDALKAPQFKYAAAAGQAIGAGTQPVSNIGRGYTNQLFGYHYDKQGHYVAAGGALGMAGKILGFQGGGGGH